MWISIGGQYLTSLIKIHERRANVEIYRKNQLWRSGAGPVWPDDASIQIESIVMTIRKGLVNKQLRKVSTIKVICRISPLKVGGYLKLKRMHSGSFCNFEVKKGCTRT